MDHVAAHVVVCIVNILLMTGLDMVKVDVMIPC